MAFVETLREKGLSEREIEVAQGVAEGITSREVAERLFVTEKCVKFHLTRIYKKLGIVRRTQLVLLSKS